ncbi:MAG: alcohol dehydrogenase catalytic domain-containing protein [Lachnospiraceae bacterium]|nr:alcohol dehydrogenase catalytic domain-containing protein [Lachnospiraceae bacterium]MCI9659812.1 alcohol dehydrogenase catalytic domain-containing protein [Lachnospiraceae bacterium]
MKEMMKEVVVVEPHKAEVREVPVPELANEDEVLIQMKSAGVCGSDHHIYHGLNPCSTYPRIPGHENAGIVVKAGANVTNVKVGDHVIVDLISTCGTCYQCTHGRKNVCEQVKVRGSGADGGWREYFTAPAKEVYKISDQVSWEDAALVEPFAIGSHCTDRGRVAEDDVVFILGAGTIGSIILQTCRAKGCKTIICCDVSDSSLERAKGYGADYIINSKKEDVVARVQEITDGHGCTLAFDSACFPGSLTLCMQPGILCNAARMVPMGFSTVEEKITQAMINQRELDIIGSRMSQNAFEPTIRRMEKGAYNTEGIATTFIRFSEIEKVFYLMDHPDESAKKMVILFDEEA